MRDNTVGPRFTSSWRSLDQEPRKGGDTQEVPSGSTEETISQQQFPPPAPASLKMTTQASLMGAQTSVLPAADSYLNVERNPGVFDDAWATYWGKNPPAPSSPQAASPEQLNGFIKSFEGASDAKSRYMVAVLSYFRDVKASPGTALTNLRDAVSGWKDDSTVLKLSDHCQAALYRLLVNEAGADTTPKKSEVLGNALKVYDQMIFGWRGYEDYKGERRVDNEDNYRFIADQAKALFDGSSATDKAAVIGNFATLLTHLPDSAVGTKYSVVMGDYYKDSNKAKAAKWYEKAGDAVNFAKAADYYFAAGMKDDAARCYKAAYSRNQSLPLNYSNVMACFTPLTTYDSDTYAMLADVGLSATSLTAEQKSQLVSVLKELSSSVRSSGDTQAAWTLKLAQVYEKEPGRDYGLAAQSYKDLVKWYADNGQNGLAGKYSAAAAHDYVLAGNPQAAAQNYLSAKGYDPSNNWFEGLPADQKTARAQEVLKVCSDYGKGTSVEESQRYRALMIAIDYYGRLSTPSDDDKGKVRAAYDSLLSGSPTSLYENKKYSGTVAEKAAFYDKAAGFYNLVADNVNKYNAASCYALAAQNHRDAGNATKAAEDAISANNVLKAMDFSAADIKERKNDSLVTRANCLALLAGLTSDSAEKIKYLKEGLEVVKSGTQGAEGYKSQLAIADDLACEYLKARDWANAKTYISEFTETSKKVDTQQSDLTKLYADMNKALGTSNTIPTTSAEITQAADALSKAVGGDADLLKQICGLLTLNNPTANTHELVADLYSRAGSKAEAASAYERASAAFLASTPKDYARAVSAARKELDIPGLSAAKAAGAYGTLCTCYKELGDWANLKASALSRANSIAVTAPYPDEAAFFAAITLNVFPLGTGVVGGREETVAEILKTGAYINLAEQKLGQATHYMLMSMFLDNELHGKLSGWKLMDSQWSWVQPVVKEALEITFEGIKGHAGGRGSADGDGGYDNYNTLNILTADAMKEVGDALKGRDRKAAFDMYTDAYLLALNTRRSVPLVWGDATAQNYKTAAHYLLAAANMIETKDDFATFGGQLLLDKISSYMTPPGDKTPPEWGAIGTFWYPKDGCPAQTDGGAGVQWFMELQITEDSYRRLNIIKEGGIIGAIAPMDYGLRIKNGDWQSDQGIRAYQSPPSCWNMTGKII